MPKDGNFSILTNFLPSVSPFFQRLSILQLEAAASVETNVVCEWRQCCVATSVETSRQCVSVVEKRVS